VTDGATVPVYFEPRLIKVGLTRDVTEDDIDRAADEATVGLDDVERARIEKSVAVINAVYGAPDRLRALAADLVEHWENRSAQQIVIVKDMLLTGFDAPPLHTLYLDRPLKGALLMQTLARVNRTFRGKPAGLLVAYAPLVDNLTKALAEYTADDQATKPVGKATDEAVALAETLMTELDQVCAGFDWRSRLDGGPRSWVRAAVGLTDYLRSPQTPGNQVREGEESLGDRFRKLANQLARTWALSSGSETWNDLRRRDARFYEEVRVWMGKFDAQERRLPAGRYRRKSSGCCRHWWPRRPLPVTSSISTRQPASRGRALRSSAPTSRPGRRRRPTRTWRSRRYGHCWSRSPSRRPGTTWSASGPSRNGSPS
jgi:hypothetical protein